MEQNKLTVRVTKCFLVQVVDANGTEIRSEYTFKDTKKEAEQVGKDLIEEVLSSDDRGESGAV